MEVEERWGGGGAGYRAKTTSFLSPLVAAKNLNQKRSHKLLQLSHISYNIYRVIKWTSTREIACVLTN